MGTRDYKNFREQNYYHVFNRGNNKMPIFLDAQDYAVFKNRLSLTLGIESSGGAKSWSKVRILPLPIGSFTILAYCLMPNHFHFLIRQNGVINVNKLMLKVCTSYAMYYNSKYDRVGHVFQGPFKAKLVDSDQYLIRLSAYIHCNPSQPLSYLYSSILSYMGERRDPLCDSSIIMKMFSTPESYRNYLEIIKTRVPLD